MSRAFTLIELLVTIAIFALMTALVVARYGTFNQGTLLTSLAYDVAITVKTAQTYGISVKTTDPNASSFSSAYGVHFDLSVPNSFYMYSDAQAGKYYVNNGDSSILDHSVVSTYNIKQGAKIVDICLSGSSAVGSWCLNDESSYPWWSAATTPYSLAKIVYADIEFVRPSPSPLIYGCLGRITNCILKGPFSDAKIIVQSANGEGQRVIDINQTGQISVGNY